MAITTFATLKTAMATWSSRSDSATVLNESVAMCEAWIAYGLEAGGLSIEPLRIRAMETSATLTISSQTTALPTRFLAKRRLYINTDPKGTLDYYTPEAFWEAFASTSSGVPRAYTIEGENLVVGPAPDSTYSGLMLYYQQPAVFSADGDTNSILTSSPQIYLFGSLYALTRLIQGHQMAPQWLADFAGSMNARNLSDRKDRFGGAQLVSRVSYAP